MDHLTLQGWLTRHAKYRANKVAIIFKNQKITFKELNERVNRLCHALKAAGVGKGDKIATLLPNSVELLEVYWACTKLGAVAAPLSPLLRGRGLSSLIQNADTKVLITNKSMVEHLDAAHEDLQDLALKNRWLIDAEAYQGYSSYQEIVNQHSVEEPEVEKVSAGDPYNIIYSSGTTGTPKGIVISQGVRSLYGSIFATSFRMTPESVVMHSGSIIFNGSFLTLMPAMHLGCTYILHDHFDPSEVIASIEKEKVTHTILVPSQIVACLENPRFNKQQLSSLEYILSVGAPLLLEHKHELNKRMPQVFYELYGLTEGFMTVLDKHDAFTKAGSVGYPPPFNQIMILDDNGQEVPNGHIGEIVGKGPLLMTEYYKNPGLTQEAFNQGGWLLTGDLGYLDSDGYLFLTGRKKDLIISGGVNIYPVDIEEILIQHPAVQDVAVIGIGHQEWGETPIAVVVLNESLKHTSSDDIKKWANENISARFQKVSDVVVAKSLPRNIAGKILKRELRELYISR